ncbi:MAG: hypothetical protein BM564_01635 [Bacteroidetes bacterium MedPE-SWsnd-G2]|nr:MAG: hypothetical protein BM564_01635 [Bacteroidetes bacterium MedPE-SWsnd-G2]
MYAILKQLVKLALFFFYKKIEVSGKEHLVDKGPLLVVANHPNTLMDPLIVAALLKQRTGFLAKSGLFKNRTVGRVLSWLHVVPVYRKVDLEPGKTPDNRTTFSKCHDYLSRKGSILIFPEGNSYNELKLREIKTGTARIALSFEDENGLEEELKILPIAIDYSNATLFYSHVSVRVGAPIVVSDFKSNNENLDSVTQVKQLTQLIEDRLEEQLPITTDKDQEEFLRQCHSFYLQYQDDAVTDIEKENTLGLRLRISRIMQKLRKSNQKLYTDTQQKLKQLFHDIKREKLTLHCLENNFMHSNKPFAITLRLLKLVLLSPIYVFGMVCNYLPYIIPSMVFKLSKLEIEFKTPVQMIVGMLLFPLYYWFMIVMIGRFVQLDYPLLLIPAFIISGQIAIYVTAQFKLLISELNFCFRVEPQAKMELVALKKDILYNFNQVKV